jgi:hypothetical protein
MISVMGIVSTVRRTNFGTEISEKSKEWETRFNLMECISWE